MSCELACSLCQYRNWRPVSLFGTVPVKYMALFNLRNVIYALLSQIFLDLPMLSPRVLVNWVIIITYICLEVYFLKYKYGYSSQLAFPPFIFLILLSCVVYSHLDFRVFLYFLLMYSSCNKIQLLHQFHPSLQPPSSNLSDKPIYLLGYY